MNVYEILRNHLKSIGADGLCTEECGCEIGDMCCCGGDMTECFPAKNNPERARREGVPFWMDPIPSNPSLRANIKVSGRAENGAGSGASP